MSKRNDISTPEGYFGNLQERLLEIPARPARVSTVRRLAPYVAIAASFLVAVILGNAILRTTATPSPEDDTWTYVSYLADALDPDGASLFDEVDWEMDQEESGLSEEDIVNYLLADGISVEHLNYLSYEADY
ncbi:MAG: hypothetical protein IKG84_06875 [Bacteroidales bacterium]|nr:hypothetical protein [Bacteroidales bacterium]